MHVLCALQAGSEVSSFAWDGSSQAYTRSPTLATQLVSLLQSAQRCSLTSAAPAVQCLPAAASQPLQFQLQLAVPRRSRILGWQPAGAAVTADSQALTLIGCDDNTPQTDVMVLIRRLDGNYLPVTVTLLSDSQTLQETADTLRVEVQVSDGQVVVCAC